VTCAVPASRDRIRFVDPTKHYRMGYYPPRNPG
jgi:hypothetical protein